MKGMDINMEKYYEIRLSSIGIAVCMLVFGVLLTLFPEVSGVVFTRGFASVVLLFAISHVWKWLRARKHKMGGTGDLIGAVLLLLLSGIGFLNRKLYCHFFRLLQEHY